MLHLDDALLPQLRLMNACKLFSARETDVRTSGRVIRLWGGEDALRELAQMLPDFEQPTLTFSGSGDFHHVTALLLERLSQRVAQPFTLIHFDNHPDWVHFKVGMHCGSWINRVASLPAIAKAITIGVSSHDLDWPEFKRANLRLLCEGWLELFPYAHLPSRVWRQYGRGAGYTQRGHAIVWRTMTEMDETDFLRLLLSRINTDSIYITIDKDVLAEQEAITNWDQGWMKLEQLCGIVQALGDRFRIIGADVIGDYSRPAYGGGAWPVAMKRLESFIDQPRRRLGVGEVAACNEVSNLALLKTFQEVMA
ncbi:MAG: arginase family protein [Pseudomonadota bacterium]|nr:arginase family protein [Pseudomonadota bacterium]MDE3037530.1 arginase family protein [Pseudomonadota bacterium]